MDLERLAQLKYVVFKGDSHVTTDKLKGIYELNMPDFTNLKEGNLRFRKPENPCFINIDKYDLIIIDGYEKKSKLGDDKDLRILEKSERLDFEEINALFDKIKNNTELLVLSIVENFQSEESLISYISYQYKPKLTRKSLFRRFLEYPLNFFKQP